MKICHWSIVLVFLCTWAKASPLDDFGGDSVRVAVSYETHFFLPVSVLSNPSQRDTLSKEDKRKIQDWMRRHTQYAQGAFFFHTNPTDFESYPGALRGIGKPILLESKVVSGKLRIRYRYEDEALFYIEMMEGENELEVDFLIPDNPKTIYSKGIPRNPKIHPVTGRPVNTCTDFKHNGEDVFWYYWNPDRKGCPSRFKKELHQATATLKVLPSTSSTFPEYEKLYGTGNKEIVINLLVGVDMKFSDPKDLGRVAFEQNLSFFRSLKDASGQALMKEISHSKFYKAFHYKTDLFAAKINVLFVNPDKPGWYKLAGKHLAEADIFVYAGHSWDGKYFPVDKLFKNTSYSLPKNKYQIAFFNACVTFSLFHSRFFDLKKSSADKHGTKNLEVLVNAIEASFIFEKVIPGAPTSENILIAKLLGLEIDGSSLSKRASWQEILTQMAQNQGWELTSMINVLGDQDNPTQLGHNAPVPVPN